MTRLLLAAALLATAGCRTDPPTVVASPPPPPDTGAVPGVIVEETTTTTSTASAPGDPEAPSPQSRTTGRGDQPPANDVWWDLALCEDGGRNRDVGGYSGYFHFLPSTWAAAGGSGRPSDHDYATQLIVAVRLQAAAGWSPWPGCSRRLGLERTAQ